MTQQDFSITHDLYMQIQLSPNAGLVGSFGDFILAFSDAKQNKRKMRLFKKMMLIHDRATGNQTINNNSL